MQWNLKVFPNEGRARLGVNLEGLAYRDWPIASLIRSELAVPTLLHVAAGKDAKNISLRFARDAWQGPSRPEIVQKLIGGEEFQLDDLTNEIWLNVLTEALGCLDADRNYSWPQSPDSERAEKGWFKARTQIDDCIPAPYDLDGAQSCYRLSRRSQSSDRALRTFPRLGKEGK
ncbi:hypothetical protein [Caballeronia sp. LZ043]|uniref:hypothetical protein n=1 Tax=Caballeronia sp. LZ043 TaxID=3038569 RepID=UPI00285CFF80|nr:hypothetical protein [Caballeronia sp. LZ043]MDR5826173.1 hypothetical protein [Caballeronia sp. LZ043]